MFIKDVFVWSCKLISVINIYRISCCGKLTNRLQNILKDFLWEALEKYGEGIEASFSCLTVVTMMAEITNTDKSLDRGMLEICVSIVWYGT